MTGMRSNLGWLVSITFRPPPSTSWKCGKLTLSTRRKLTKSWGGRKTPVSTWCGSFCRTFFGIKSRWSFKKRIDLFLTIASKHHIRTMFVLFDSCFDPRPRLGPQHPPVPGVHNSAWVQSPGAAVLGDTSQYPQMKAYVQGIVGAFAKDPRVLAWDIWNEPNNIFEPYAKFEAKDKIKIEQALLPQAFAWARSANPTQPLTSGTWKGNDWSSLDKVEPDERIQLEESDILTFHNYSWPEEWEQRAQWLQSYHRPVICTEFMARGLGNTFDTILPLAKKDHVGVNAATLVLREGADVYCNRNPGITHISCGPPPIWFHDMFYPDGRPLSRRQEIKSDS